MKTILIVSLIVMLGIASTAIIFGAYCFTRSRAQTVEILTQYALSRAPELKNTPVTPTFTDIAHLSIYQQQIIELARAIGITAGTTSTTFSPDEITPFWQWSILYGKAVMVSRH